MMRIGIDFHAAERDGSGNCTYIRNLVESLLKVDTASEYFLYVADRAHPYYERFSNIPNAMIRETGMAKIPFLRIPLLGLQTFIDKIDVLHSQYIAPPVHSGKSVVIVHDLAFLHFPECFHGFERYRSTWLIPRNARRADAVLTVSQYSKDDIVARCRVPADKVTVTYNGRDTRFAPVPDDVAAAVLKKYGLTGPYILAVGRLDPRKNLLRLIEAFNMIKKAGSVVHKLVIIGKPDYRSHEIERALAAYRSDIVMAGYVPNDELAAFYSAASVFVYPTIFEGFGLPCLESMSCGCPVISSRTSSIPEVVGDAAILIDPCQVPEIAAAIRKVLSDAQLAATLKRKGMEQAKKFDWETTALRTLAVYEKAYAGRSEK